jgi:hypothetical protein
MIVIVLMILCSGGISPKDQEQEQEQENSPTANQSIGE